MRILIAEDNPVSCRLLKVTLMKWGYEVVSTTNGTDAFEALQREDAPPLAILDVEMPGMSGFEVCQQLRRTPRDTPTYVILLTANESKAHAVAGLESGADDYIRKPFDKDELRARVQVGLRITGLQSSLAKHVRVLQNTTANLQSNSQSLALVNENLVREMAERKQTEEALLLAHTENEQLLAALPSILIGLDMHAHIIRWNQSACKTLGALEADVMGKSIDECGIEWESYRITQALCSELSPGQTVHLDDVCFKRADGKEGVLGITISIFEGATGKESGYLLFGADVTRRRIMEGQLRQAQKLESIGQLAAGIAHEINTPTQYVGDNTRFLLTAFDDLSRVQEKHLQLLAACRKGAFTPELIDEIEALLKEADVEYLTKEIPAAIKQALEGTDRIAKIVQSMKDFAHPDTGEKKAVDLNKAIESTITVARNEWKYVADMETDFDTQLPPVPCLLGEFNQVILNMIINAAHATADVVGEGDTSKGTISISTRLQGEWAEIRISDTGSGIPEKVRSRIFDPFFTTKGVGKGTGQGLAISHAVVVEKHGGKLSFETEMGRGTTFIINLPLR